MRSRRAELSVVRLAHVHAVGAVDSLRQGEQIAVRLRLGQACLLVKRQRLCIR